MRRNSECTWRRRPRFTNDVSCHRRWLASIFARPPRSRACLAEVLVAISSLAFCLTVHAEPAGTCASRWPSDRSHG